MHFVYISRQAPSPCSGVSYHPSSPNTNPTIPRIFQAQASPLATMVVTRFAPALLLLTLFLSLSLLIQPTSALPVVEPVVCKNGHCSGGIGALHPRDETSDDDNPNDYCKTHWYKTACWCQWNGCGGPLKHSR